MLHDVDIKVKARLSETATAETVINYGNYLPFLGSIASYSNQDSNRGAIGAPHQIHASSKRLLLMKHSPSTTHQTVQTGTKGGVEALDIGTVQLLLGQRERFALLCCSLNQTGFDFDETAGMMAFDHLTDHHLRPS